MEWHSLTVFLFLGDQLDGFMMTRIRILLQLQGLGQVGLSRFPTQHGALLQSAFCLQPNLIKNAQRQVRQICIFKKMFTFFAVLKLQLLILSIWLLLLGDYAFPQQPGMC